MQWSALALLKKKLACLPIRRNYYYYYCYWPDFWFPYTLIVRGGEAEGEGEQVRVNGRRTHLGPLLALERCCSSSSSSTVMSATFPVTMRSSSSSSSFNAGGSFRCTAICRRDVRRQNRGESQRLTFEERADRRSGKLKELRASREEVLEEMQRVVDTEFPEALEALYEKVHAKATIAALKVLNVFKCIEGLDIEIQPGRTVPLGRAAQLVKLDHHTLEISAPTVAIATAALQRISRLDGTYQITKESNGRLRVSFPVITTQHRERAAALIRECESTLKSKAKSRRTEQVKWLAKMAANATAAAGVDSTATLQQWTEQMDAHYEHFLLEKTGNLALLVQQVMTMES